MSGMTAAQRRAHDAVLIRDGNHCQRCGRSVVNYPASVHHRRPRGMGGSRAPLTWDLSNLVLLCGDATTPEGCHLRVESYRRRAEMDGWLVRQSEDPRLKPVWRLQGTLVVDGRWQWLSGSGWSDTPPAVTA